MKKKIFDRLKTEGEEKFLKKILVVPKGESWQIVTEMSFEAARTRGETLIKAVVMEGASLELGGLIKIAKGVGAVEAFLRQSVLLVGKGARAVVVPTLEIESNEVKASHAAAIGKIDEEQLYYLMSRGFSRKTAEKMIIKAFIDE